MRIFPPVQAEMTPLLFFSWEFPPLHTTHSPAIRTFSSRDGKEVPLFFFSANGPRSLEEFISLSSFFFYYVSNPFLSLFFFDKSVFLLLKRVMNCFFPPPPSFLLWVRFLPPRPEYAALMSQFRFPFRRYEVPPPSIILYFL